MKKFLTATAAIALLFGVTAGVADAQPRRDNDRHQQNDHRGNGYRQHNEWRKGARLSHNDWSRGHRVDYRTRHLQRPPRGYEWREVDGNLILGAVATGLIFSIIANQH